VAYSAAAHDPQSSIAAWPDLRGDRLFVNPTPAIACSYSDSPPPKELVQSHVSIGRDRTAMQRDINVVLPIDRMRELAASNCASRVFAPASGTI
jgi:hypothetical protein